MKYLGTIKFFVAIILTIFVLPNYSIAQNKNMSITITPSEVLQGDPIMIQISGVKISDIKKLTFNNKKLNIFTYKNLPTALVGIDLNQKVGDYIARVQLVDGKISSTTLQVLKREKYETYLPVPEKLGGNSTSSQTKVISTLEKENAVLAVLKTFPKNLWVNNFIYPVSDPKITDTYGFSRTSGAASITHKGVDFKALEGTKILSVNKGIVRIARNFSVYGKTVVVDHGYGLMSFYLHMSKIKVNEDQLVQKGQTIGLAGTTGFSTGPHLHFSVRINNISIDPIKFLDLLK